MKKLSLLLFIAFSTNVAFTQENGDKTPPPPPPLSSHNNEDKISSPPPPEIYEFVGQEALYPGGIGALYQYLGSNIKYPEECADKNIQGKVYLQFVIEKDGSIGHVSVMNEGKTHELLEEEAIRVIKSLPNWKPARVNGDIVRSWQKIPINFKLREENKD